MTEAPKVLINIFFGSYQHYLHDGFLHLLPCIPVTLTWPHLCSLKLNPVFHMQTSQYFLQVVKYENWRCCKWPKGSYFTITPDHFLPPPILLSQLPEGRFQVPNASDHKNHKLPFSLYCASYKF